MTFSNKIQKWTELPMLPVAWGEVFDKLTILEIKLANVMDVNKRANIEKEKLAIQSTIGDTNVFPDELWIEVQKLKDVNIRQWDIQDGLRECERKKIFGERLIELVRDEYHINDERALIKRRINELLGSEILEEKSYEPY